MHKLGSKLELLNSFEVSVVVMIAIGFLITGLILFSSLTPKQQTNLSSSLEIFDIHEQVSRTTETVKLIFDGQQEFLNQFYLAFVEVTTLPSESIDAMASIGDFRKISANIANDLGDLFYRVSLNYSAPSSGKVAGASISLFDQYAQREDEIYFNKPEILPDSQYHYEAPKLNQIFTKVDWQKYK